MSVVSAESTDVRWFDVDDLPEDCVPGFADRVRLRPEGSQDERNDAHHRELVGLRSDLRWVREILARHAAADGSTVVSGGMRKIVLTTEEAALGLDLL